MNAAMAQAATHPLNALSPLDGRYHLEVGDLNAYFAESALIRARIRVEIEWLLEQAGTPEILYVSPVSDAVATELRAIVTGFCLTDAERVKTIEAETGHDVKAVEYFIRECLVTIGLGDLCPYVHFGCTSEDINNLAYGMLLRDAIREVWVPTASAMVDAVASSAFASRDAALLSLTHGQPATPSTLGKELAVFVARWHEVIEILRSSRITGKFNGATGTYGAYVTAYPEAPWLTISRTFVERCGLTWNPLTTQIEPHDHVARILHTLVQFNTILIDFCSDIWSYVSRGIFTQRRVAGEVGSSVMPHKVNPVRFENAEANAGLSIAISEHLARSLPISRLQRDLTDSSRMRNLGVAFGYSLVAVRSTLAGIALLEPNRERMIAELKGKAEVLAEPIQTVLRNHGAQDAYERLASLVQDGITIEELRRYVAAADVPEPDRQRLLNLTPDSYVGLAATLTEDLCKSVSVTEGDLAAE